MDERVSPQDVEELIKTGKTYKEISDILKTRFNGDRGFSVSSVKRFCSRNGLSTIVSSETLELEISHAVDEVSLNSPLLYICGLFF